MKDNDATNLGAHRTCVGCAAVDDSDNMERFVLDPAKRVCLDVSRGLPGRGAWLHLNEACFQKAIKRRGFKRVFKTDIVILDALWSLSLKAIEQDIVRVAQRQRLQGQAVIGVDPVMKADVDIRWCICASDLSPNRRALLSKRVERVITVSLEKDELAKALGIHKPVGVIGIGRVASEKRARLGRCVDLDFS